MKAKLTLLAALIFAGNLLAQSPTPVPVETVTPPQTLTLRLKDIPVATVEALRQAIVASGAFAFPAGLDSRPILSLQLHVTGSTARGMIVLGATAP